MRSEDVKDLNFSLKEDVIPPGFYQGEVKVKKQRHLIFATEQQLNLLAAAKSWYIDRIDKMVKVPFHQLISISTFVMSVESAKQVPLAFILMSSRKKRDYKKVSVHKTPFIPAYNPQDLIVNSSLWLLHISLWICVKNLELDPDNNFYLIILSSYSHYLFSG